jgi:GTPase
MHHHPLWETFGFWEETLMPLSVMLMGRPNVGKSTLFNRLLKKKVALTADEPGVTRDWQRYEVQLLGLPLSLFDTPGLVFQKTQCPLSQLIQKQAKDLLSSADVVLWMLDALSGMTRDDQDVLAFLRKSGAYILPIINKAEKYQEYGLNLDLQELGFDRPLSISALHGVGLEELRYALSKIPVKNALPPPSQEKPFLQVVILGRPNAGKSTLINRCLGYDRLLTSEIAGTTRDAVHVTFNFDQHPIALVDTAGLRKRSAISEEVEKKSCSETFHALIFAHVAVVLLDATRGLEKQDLVILQKVIQEGRGMVIALNKWDQVSRQEQSHYLKSVQKCLSENACGPKSIPIIPTSAINGYGLTQIWKEVLNVYKRWQKRLSTSQLNRFLEVCLQRHPPAMVSGKRIRIKYMTQIKSRPPCFVIFGNQLDELEDSYKRYLRNALCEQFDFQGVPIRLLFKNSENPYHAKSAS